MFLMVLFMVVGMVFNFCLVFLFFVFVIVFLGRVSRNVFYLLLLLIGVFWVYYNFGKFWILFWYFGVFYIEIIIENIVKEVLF